MEIRMQDPQPETIVHLQDINIIKIENDKTSKVNQYQVWEGNHSFWFWGRIITGKKPFGLILTFILINGVNIVGLQGTWLALFNECEYIWPLAVGVAMWFIVNVLLVRTSMRDPGIIPRQQDDEHTYAHRYNFNNRYILDGLHGQSAQLMSLKYCYTCLIFRPKRTVHCSDCDACIQEMDHHCPFVSNCIGKRNYMAFFLFCFTLWLDTIWLFGMTAFDLNRRINMNQELSLKDQMSATMKQFPLSIPLSIISGCAMVLLSLLVGLHLKLACGNKTTSELYKDPYRNYIKYPYDTGSRCENFRTAICRLKKVDVIFNPLENAFDRGLRVGTFLNIAQKTSSITSFPGMQGVQGQSLNKDNSQPTSPHFVKLDQSLQFSAIKQKSQGKNDKNFYIYQQKTSPSAASEQDVKNSYNASLSDEQSRYEQEAHHHIATDDDLIVIKDQAQKLLTKKTLKVCDSFNELSPPRDLPSQGQGHGRVRIPVPDVHPEQDQNQDYITAFPDNKPVQIDPIERIQLSSSLDFDANWEDSVNVSVRQISLNYSRTSMSRVLNSQKEIQESSGQLYVIPGPRKQNDFNMNRSKIEITVDFTLDVSNSQMNDGSLIGQDRIVVEERF